MILAVLIGILPAMLLVSLGGRIQHSISDEKDSERWLNFLLGTLALVLAVLVLAMSADSPLFFTVSVMLLSTAGGIVAFISLQLFSDRKVWTRKTPKTTLLLLVVGSLLILLGIAGDLTAPFFIAINGAFLAFVWIVWNRMGRKVLLVWGIQTALFCVSIWATYTNMRLIESPKWLSGFVELTVIYLIPAMAIAVTAGMVHDICKRDPNKNWHSVLLLSLLVLSLLYLIGYQIFLASVWDVTTDGLGGIFLWMIVSVSAVTIAMVLAWFLPGKRKFISLVFAITVPLSMRYALWSGSHIPNGQWGESPSYITEQRAERIANAIQRYYEDHGTYPQSLNDLFPQHLVFIPRPIMIPGQTWCYEGGEDYYRFGYVYRQYFSTPATVQIHATAGEVPSPYWPCNGEANKYPPPPGYFNP